MHVTLRRGFRYNAQIVASSNPWSDPKAPPAGFTLPVSMGPINLPPPPRKRQWGWLVVCGLFAFAGGVVAGPSLKDQAFALVEGTISATRKHAPKFLRRWLPDAPAGESAQAPARRVVAPSLPPAIGAKAASGEAGGVPPMPEARPAQPVEQIEPEAPGSPPEPAPAAESEPRQAVAVAEAPSGRRSHAKGAARTASAGKANPPARKHGKYQDPFETEGDEAGANTGASTTRQAKNTAGSASASVKSEPAARSAAPNSSDPLDSLIADAVTETKPKGKKRNSKGIDDMLKDVQKGNPAPSSKHAAAAELPPLSRSDISKAMAGVKSKGNDCAHRLKSKGIAELKITVGKNGKVTDVRVGGKVGNTPLAACIEKAARAATFPPNAGLRFDYRIDVR